MSLLGRIFGKDPEKELEKAAGRLDRGEPFLALEAARRALEHGDPEQRERAEELAERARRALLSSALERSDAAAAEGAVEDAEDWLEAARNHAVGEAEEQQIETRADALEQRARESAAAAWRGPSPEGEGGEGGGVDAETHYEALLEMLDEGVADRWAGRPETFRTACFDLAEGRPQQALEALETLREESGDDAVLALERGRCRLLLGEEASARKDFETAWKELGDAPLDRAQTLSVPLLWADAALAAGDAGEVRDRLRGLAVPGQGDAELCHLYAQALVSCEAGESRSYLGDCLRAFPGDPRFPHQLALLLVADGEREVAVRCLEAATRQSCAGGSCAGPPRFHPSLRLLASLYLQGEESPEEARRLLDLIRLDRRGRLTLADLELEAAYHRAVGNEDTADQVAAVAEQLRAEGREETEEEVPSPALRGPTQRRIL
jgi:hypothetical protein